MRVSFSFFPSGTSVTDNFSQNPAYLHLSPLHTHAGARRLDSISLFRLHILHISTWRALETRKQWRKTTTVPLVIPLIKKQWMVSPLDKLGLREIKKNTCVYPKSSSYHDGWPSTSDMYRVQSEFQAAVPDIYVVKVRAFLT